MRTGIASNAKSPYTSNFTPIGPVNTTEAELQGIEHIIHIFRKAECLYIFSDSLSAITLLFEFPKYSPSKQMKVPNRATVKRILATLSLYGLSLTSTLPPLQTHSLPEKSIFLGHIHSHMKENAEKRKKFLKSNSDKYGPFTQAIIEGNSLADKLASDNLKLARPSPALFLTNGNDIWQLTNRINEEPIYETCRNVIADTLLELDKEKFKIEAPSFSKRLLDPLVSLELTTYLLNSHKPKHAMLGDFVHKLINKSLPTKNRLKNYADSISDKSIHPAKKSKILSVYGDTFCDFCKSKGIFTLEDSAHIFTHCPLGHTTNDKTFQDLQRLVSKNCLGDVSLPPWFSSNQTLGIIIDEAEADLSAFPKSLGDLGYIPKALHSWCRSHFPKDHQRIAKKLATIVQKGAHIKWNNRCEFMFKKKVHTPKPHNPDDPTYVTTPITPIGLKSKNSSSS